MKTILLPEKQSSLVFPGSVITCFRLSLYLCLEEALWLSCPSSCSTLPFNSSQWHFIWETFTQKCPASPGVTNLVRAPQSASMCSRAVLRSSKALSTVWEDVGRNKDEWRRGHRRRQDRGEKEENWKKQKKFQAFTGLTGEYLENPDYFLQFYNQFIWYTFGFCRGQFSPRGWIRMSSYFFLIFTAPLVKLILSLTATSRDFTWSEWEMRKRSVCQIRNTQKERHRRTKTLKE